MIYGYPTNEKFIDKAYLLLDKLRRKQLWQKDTLIVALDKSARPLAYALRKLSQEEGKAAPDMRFFNYSSHFENSDFEPDEVADFIREKIGPEKFSGYKSILLLDDHLYTGNSLKNMKKVIESYFSGNEGKKAINLAALGTTEGHFKIKKRDFIFVDKDLSTQRADEAQTGVRDKEDYEKSNIQLSHVRLSEREKDKEVYADFIKNRGELARDIKNYIHKRQIQEGKTSLLEKAVRIFSIIFIASGLILGYGGITGNVTGNSATSDSWGVVLIVFGTLGLVISRKISRNSRL